MLGYSKQLGCSLLKSFSYKQFSSSKQWLARQRKDIYAKEAREGEFRSRAYFKLLDIQQKYKIIKPGAIVIDLGAAPGGWSLLANNIVNTNQGMQLIPISYDNSTDRYSIFIQIRIVNFL
jgi:23S rRNA U2552 (ribose-2'-O)-methylase RlmE/FtsJ